MIKKYIIDGNNLIGKISELWSIQKKDKQLSRVKLAKVIDQYFRDGWLEGDLKSWEMKDSDAEVKQE